jgi:ABC-type glycerol-3-phosphate transport system substrate-binding protein
MQRHRRFIAVAAAFAAVATPLAASAATAGHRANVTISFMEAMSSGTQKPTLDALTQNFESTHPGITVNLIAEPNYGVLQQKEEAAVAAGNPPTIGQAYENWAAAFASAKAIIPLDGYVNSKRVGVPKSFKSHIWKGVWKDLFLPDGKIWMWPFNKSDYVLFYNANMLKAAGLAVPKTWARYAADERKVTSGGNWGESLDTGTLSAPANGTLEYLSMVKAFGGTWVKNGKPTLDTKASVEALQFLAGLKSHGALQVGTNYPEQTALGAGRSAFAVSSIAGYPYMLDAVGGKFDMQVAPLPAGPHGGEGNAMAGTNIVVFANASAAERAAAWQFMKYLSSPHATAYWAIKTGYLPVTKSALVYMKKYIAAHPYQKIAAEALQYAGGNPPYAWWTQAEGYVAEAMQAVLDNGASPASALATAQQKAMAAAKS